MNTQSHQEKSYIEAVNALKEFDLKNADLLAKREVILANVENAELAMRALALDSKDNIEVPELATRFVFSQAYEKNVSHEEAVRLIKESTKGAAKQNALSFLQEISEVTVDVARFMDSIRDGILPNEARSALTEKPKKPYVSKRSIV